jgi:hypothetical protein
MVLLLIEEGIDIVARGERGMTTLHYAAAGEQTAMVQLLIVKGQIDKRQISVEEHLGAAL